MLPSSVDVELIQEQTEGLHQKSMARFSTQPQVLGVIKLTQMEAEEIHTDVK